MLLCKPAIMFNNSDVSLAVEKAGVMQMVMS